MEVNSTKESIIKILGKNMDGLTIADIAKSLDLNRHTASKYVFALQESGYVECHESGRSKICVLKRGGKR